MAALSFRYESREAWLSPLGEQPSPATYDLCAEHAARTRPPHGWQLRDQRPAPEAPAGDTPRDEPDTVTVLAAALRALPTPAAEW